MNTLRRLLAWLRHNRRMPYETPTRVDPERVRGGGLETHGKHH